MAFDAWTGTLKWTLDTGGPLVVSTGTAKDSASTSDEYNDDEATCEPNQSGQYQYIPSLDGHVYSLSRSGELEVLRHSASDLAHSPIPLQSSLSQLEKAFLVGHKYTKIFGVDVKNGQIEYLNHPSQQKPQTSSSSSNNATSTENEEQKQPSRIIHIGRSEYTSQAIHAENGTTSWSITIGELFVHSQNKAECPNPSKSSSFIEILHEVNAFSHPDIEFGFSKSNHGESQLIAKDPSSKRILWDLKFPNIIVSVHGITNNGNIFMRKNIAGPSSSRSATYKRPPFLNNDHETTPSPQLLLSSGQSMLHSGDSKALSVQYSASSSKIRYPTTLYVVRDQPFLVPSNSIIHSTAIHRPIIKPGKSSESTFSPGTSTNPDRTFIQMLKDDRMSSRPHTTVTAEGLFVSWKLVGWIALCILLFSSSIAFVCYRRGQRKFLKKTTPLDIFKRFVVSVFRSSPMVGIEESSPLLAKKIEDPYRNFDDQFAYPSLRRPPTLNFQRSPLPSLQRSPTFLQRSISLGALEELYLTPPPSINAIDRSKPPLKKQSKSFENLAEKQRRTSLLHMRSSQSMNSNDGWNGTLLEGAFWELSQNGVNEDVEFEFEFFNDQKLQDSHAELSEIKNNRSMALEDKKEKIKEEMDIASAENPARPPLSDENIIPFVSTHRFANEFENLQVLGKGGFGEVSLARNRLDGRKYAVKRISLSMSNQWRHRLQKVLREVKILARLDHPNIVRYYQAWLEEMSVDEKQHSVDPASLSEATSQFDGDNDLTNNGSKIHDDYSREDFTNDLNDDIVWDRPPNEDLDSDGFQPIHIVSQQPCDFSNNKPRKMQQDRSSSGMTSSTALYRKGRGKKSRSKDHWLFIQMQYCSQRSLLQYLNGRENGSVDLNHALRIFSQIANGLAYVHECGLIHRDLKPVSVCVCVLSMNVVSYLTLLYMMIREISWPWMKTMVRSSSEILASRDTSMNIRKSMSMKICTIIMVTL